MSLVGEPEGTVVRSTTTDNRGAFAFSLLSPGAYAVTYTQPGGEMAKTQMFQHDARGLPRWTSGG